MSLQPFVNVLKIYARWREGYLTKHPEKRLLPTLERTYVALTPKQPIITPGPAMEKALDKTKNFGLLLLFGLVAIAVLGKKK